LVFSLLEVVEEILGERLRSRCVLWGGFPYDPVAMFSVLVYALICGERASRRMETMCTYDVRFWYLSGGTTPDQSKFCRFRQRLDQDGGLEELMHLVTQKAVALGLIKGRTIVVDGTKIPGSCSQWRKYLNQTEAADAAAESENAPSVAAEVPAPETPVAEAAVSEAPVSEATVAEVPASEAAAPEAPQPAKAKRGRKPKAPKPEKPKKPVKPSSDPEARTMKTTHGEYIIGYNLQIAVDGPSNFVLGAMPTNEANDLNAMATLLDAVENQSGLVPRRVVADAGYDSAQNHKAVDEAGASGYICPRRRGPTPFTQDENGVFRCLAGHEATSRTTPKDGVEYITYRVSRCKGCPLAQACGHTGKSHQREMNVRSQEHGELSKQNKRRCARAAGKELLKCRGQTVERVNARIKRDLRMRRLHLKGLRGARIELLIACLTLNLQTLLKDTSGRFTRFYAGFSPRTARAKVGRGSCHLAIAVLPYASYRFGPPSTPLQRSPRLRTLNRLPMVAILVGLREQSHGRGQCGHQ
jgi:transposase